MTREQFAARHPLRWLSYSQNACLIRFVGGPAHGRVELYDHDRWSAISFGGDSCTYQYEPDGRRVLAPFYLLHLSTRASLYCVSDIPIKGTMSTEETLTAFCESYRPGMFSRAALAVLKAKQGQGGE